MSLFAVLTVGMVTANPASAVTIHLNNIAPNGARYCATPQGNSTANGTVVTLWTCTGSSLQEWYWQGDMLRLSGTNKCLTPRGNASATNGAVLTLWDCDSSYTSPQRFVEATARKNNDPLGEVLGTRIYTAWGGKCITNYGGDFGNGVYMTLWSCATNLPNEQYWYTGW